MFLYAFHDPLIQILNFREDETVSIFYACCLHVLCIIPILIIHLESEKHDVSGGNHGYARWKVHLVKSFFLHGNKINFYSSSY
jgi:hypothetical protein